MLTIGQFARLAQVSQKLLRHYERIGLLLPVSINRETGYRYYALEQLDRLNKILALQNLGLSLKAIIRLLDEQISVEELRGMLRLKQAELHQQIEQEQQRLREVETRLAQIETADPAFQAYAVALKSTPSVRVAGVRRVLTDGDAINPLFRAVHEVLVAEGVKIGQVIGRYDLSEPLDVQGRECESFLMANGRRVHWSEHPGARIFDLEAVFAISGSLSPHARLSDGTPVVERDLPALTSAAAIVHRGGLSERSHVYRVFTDWSNANDYVVNGAIREVYLRYMGRSDHADNLLEIQFPVETKGMNP